MKIEELRNKIDEAEKFIRSDAPQEEKDKKMEEIRSLTKDFENAKELEESSKKIAQSDVRSAEESKSEKKETRKMEEKKFETPTKGRVKITEDKGDEVRSAINAYAHSHGKEVRDGLKEVDNEVIVPKDVVYNPKQQVNTVYDLRQYVQNISVNSASGTYPVQDQVNATFTAINELDPNGTMAKPVFNPIDYKISTYRGQLPISQEIIDDTNFDVAGLIGNMINTVMLNTSNKQIATKMGQATAVSISSKDDLTDSIKEIINSKLDPAYVPTIVASSSFVQAVDTLKDKNGQYILQQDISQATGKRLLGLNLVRVPDTAFGSVGDAKAWIGDPRAITFFNRNQNTVRWVWNENYGQILAGSIRFDTEVTDTKGAFMVSIGGSNSTPSKA